jgi:hypothetical protein
MLIAGMVQDQVEDDIHITVVNLLDELLTVRHGPILWSDTTVVPHIITMVSLWTVKERGEPYGLYAQVLEIVKLRDYPLKVTYPVARAILEASRVYLINNRLLPPWQLCRAARHF